METRFYNINEIAAILGLTVAAVHAHLVRRNYDAVPLPVRLGNRSPTEAEVRELRKLLRERGIDPDSARGEHLYDLAISNAKKSFTGYIIGLLKSAPDYGRELDTIPREERQNRPVAIGEILLQSPLLAGQRERLALTNNNSAIIDTKKGS